MMRNSHFILFVLLLSAICTGYFWHCNKKRTFRDRLKYEMDIFEEKKYKDSTYGFYAAYPEFFKCDTISGNYVCFGFHIETNMIIEYFVMPNKKLYSFDNGMKHIMKENHARMFKRKKDCFVISGYYYMDDSQMEGYCYYSKYVYRKRIWYVCRLIYEEKYKSCLDRLFRMVDGWTVWK